jgi:hypothetical protein
VSVTLEAETMAATLDPPGDVASGAMKAMSSTATAAVSSPAIDNA